MAARHAQPAFATHSRTLGRWGQDRSTTEGFSGAMWMLAGGTKVWKEWYSREALNHQSTPHTEAEEIPVCVWRGQDYRHLGLQCSASYP